MFWAVLLVTNGATFVGSNWVLVSGWLQKEGIQQRVGKPFGTSLLGYIHNRTVPILYSQKEVLMPTPVALIIFALYSYPITNLILG
jgi:hypothetical protein